MSSTPALPYTILSKADTLEAISLSVSYIVATPPWLGPDGSGTVLLCQDRLCVLGQGKPPLFLAVQGDFLATWF